MNRLSRDKQIQILSLLVEGGSLRAASRLADCSINTVTKLLVDAGTVCTEYQDRVFKDLTCKRLQADEIWSFCYAKARNVPQEKRGEFGFGDVWTWTAICADTKLVPSWFVGRRDLESAVIFMKDLASRLKNRVQLTTDGHRAYVEAVEQAFGADIDFAMLIKVYGFDNPKAPQARYSPAECVGTETMKINGTPKSRHISTSFAERQNLTMRMSIRRFTRLTNAFSKKVENHACAVALHFMYYNFCRIHKSLRVTPAMAAGVTSKLWEIGDVVDLINKIYLTN